MIRHWRYLRFKSHREIRFFFFGFPVRLEYDPLYPGYNGTRSVAFLMVETARGSWSIMFQRCLEGFALPRHQDCDTHNHVWWFELMRPRRGGELIVYGPSRRFLRGRVCRFDGKDEHEVIRVEKGRRMILMWQRSTL